MKSNDFQDQWDTCSVLTHGSGISQNNDARTVCHVSKTYIL